MFGSHFEIQDGCLSLIKLTNIILTVAAETLNPCRYEVNSAGPHLFYFRYPVAELPACWMTQTFN